MRKYMRVLRHPCRYQLFFILAKDKETKFCFGLFWSKVLVQNKNTCRLQKFLRSLCLFLPLVFSLYCPLKQWHPSLEPMWNQNQGYTIALWVDTQTGVDSRGLRRRRRREKQIYEQSFWQKQKQVGLLLLWLEETINRLNDCVSLCSIRNLIDLVLHNDLTFRLITMLCNENNGRQLSTRKVN